MFVKYAASHPLKKYKDFINLRRFDEIFNFFALVFVFRIEFHFQTSGELWYDMNIIHIIDKKIYCTVFEIIQCDFFTNFLDKCILIVMTLFSREISLTFIFLIVHSNYVLITNFIWIFRENAAVAILHFSTALWVTLKFEMQERSRTFCLFLEYLLKFRPTFYDQFPYETAIAIVNTPNYKYYYYYKVSKVKIVYT